MRVLVLGGSGFIAPHIIRRLYELGHRVAVLRRGLAARKLPDGVEVIAGDRNCLMESAADFRQFRPEVVVDVLAFTEAQACGLVATFTGIAERVVVLSSGDVYRANDVLFRRIESTEIEPTPLTEIAPLRDRLYPYRGVSVPPMEGTNFDDYDKILVERAVMGHAALPATILRLPMVYGPGARDVVKRRFWPYLKRMDEGRPAILLDQRTARWRAPFGYAGDVAEAVRLAVENERAAGEIYNVAESAALDMEGWLRELAAVTGWRGRIVVVDEPCPAPNLPRSMNLDQNLNMDSAKIRHELGFQELIPRRQALERTIRWDRDHPPEHTDTAQFDYAAEDAILARAGAL